MSLRRVLSRDRALILVLVAVAILIGLHFRQPASQPADYCTNGNHVIITTDHAQIMLNSRECR